MVVALAVAVVITAGGATAAIWAVAAVAHGMAATTTAATIAAGAFIGASVALGAAAFYAANHSNSIEEFNEHGNWGTVIATVGGGVVGGVSGYTIARDSGLTKEEKLLSNKTFTNSNEKLSHYTSDDKGYEAAESDFYSMNPSNVHTTSNGTLVGDLPNGAKINIHPGHSVGKAPTVEIIYSTGFRIKIRY